MRVVKRHVHDKIGNGYGMTRLYGSSTIIQMSTTPWFSVANLKSGTHGAVMCRSKHYSCFLFLFLRSWKILLLLLCFSLLLRTVLHAEWPLIRNGYALLLHE